MKERFNSQTIVSSPCCLPVGSGSPTAPGLFSQAGYGIGHFINTWRQRFALTRGRRPKQTHFDVHSMTNRGTRGRCCPLLTSSIDSSGHIFVLTSLILFQPHETLVIQQTCLCLGLLNCTENVQQEWMQSFPSVLFIPLAHLGCQRNDTHILRSPRNCFKKSCFYYYFLFYTLRQVSRMGLEVTVNPWKLEKTG